MSNVIVRVVLGNGIERGPIDKHEHPRRYAPAFLEHERALAWTRMITAEHYALYGMRQGCHHVSAGRAGPGAP